MIIGKLVCRIAFILQKHKMRLSQQQHFGQQVHEQKQKELIILKGS
jgi:hypothetical protein